MLAVRPPRPAAAYPYFDAPTPLALAHRGGAEYAPNVGRENTVAAFAEAVAMGYRYLETDVHATADGRLVAFHDDVLDRVTDAVGALAGLPWAEVERARTDAGDAVPLMDELFETFPDARFNIDIKAPRAVQPLVEAVRRHGALHRVCVGSFSDQRLRAARRLLGPDLATSAGPAGVAGMRLLPRLLSRLISSPAQALQIPVTHPVAGREVTLVLPKVLAAAHSTGKQVHVWTIDDAEEMHRLLDLGVDGIVTDRIDTLRDVLAERGTPLPG
ncbi:glycerophosphodiester phosphodiesterase [Marihabitans asiaticum]|uniref:Glycerophosphoryl diester phosphodiesterase n=1 Tax=Marihabitans asiaticum TaxID=415218 RepID=A0A560W802_9MICO|nr:glycerophosphodiester phosphodiesterase [Marihabitans asiaticum]TWD13741.1 glycerophosphoryl diester phosphodiesterase [Marihabitans asiaticum]